MGLIWVGAGAIFAAQGYMTPALVGFVGGSIGVLALARPLLRTSERVQPSKNGIEAWTYADRHVAMGWEDIGSIQRFHKPRRRRPLEMVRLRSFDGRRHITFTGRIVGFSDLLAIIEARASLARREGAPWWEQMQWW